MGAWQLFLNLRGCPGTHCSPSSLDPASCDLRIIQDYSFAPKFQTTSTVIQNAQSNMRSKSWFFIFEYGNSFIMGIHTAFIQRLMMHIIQMVIYD